MWRQVGDTREFAEVVAVGSTGVWMVKRAIDNDLRFIGLQIWIDVAYSTLQASVIGAARRGSRQVR